MPNSFARHRAGYTPLANANKRLRVRDSQRSLITVSRIASAAAGSTAAEGQPAPTFSQPAYPPEYYEAKRKYGSDGNVFA